MKMLKSAWESAEVNNTFLPGTFFNKHIKSAWESAEVEDTFCQALYICFDKMSQLTRFVAFWPNVAIYALCRILLKCHNLRALSHFAEMSQFTHISRHKI